MRMIITKIVQRLRYYLYKIRGYNVDITSQLERNLNLDRYNPQGIHIGAYTIITSNVTILSHYLIPVKSQNKYVGKKVNTKIGNFCVVGIGAIIMPGITIGDEVVIGAGAVVTRNIPSNSIAVGNPAKVIKTDIRMENIEL